MNLPSDHPRSRSVPVSVIVPVKNEAENLDFVTRNFVLACGTLLLYLYARRRLSRPETLLS